MIGTQPGKSRADVITAINLEATLAEQGFHKVGEASADNTTIPIPKELVAEPGALRILDKALLDPAYQPGKTYVIYQR